MGSVAWLASYATVGKCWYVVTTLVVCVCVCVCVCDELMFVRMEVHSFSMPFMSAIGR